MAILGPKSRHGMVCPAKKNISKIIPGFFAVAGIGSISRPVIYHTERIKSKREKREVVITAVGEGG